MTKLRIDFVSDISCPWCAVGLASLQAALNRLDGEIQTELHIQPFELFPDLGPDGISNAERIKNRPDLTPDEVRRRGEAVAERGRELGLTLNMEKRTHIYNTFDAHRLLHWAEQENKQIELKQAILRAYFTHAENPSSHEVLLRICGEQGLDTERARQILESDEFSAEVRERENFYTNQGISSVPSIIINNRHLIQGGQTPEVFMQALRQIAESATE